MNQFFCFVVMGFVIVFFFFSLFFVDEKVKFFFDVKEINFLNFLLLLLVNDFVQMKVEIGQVLIIQVIWMLEMEVCVVVDQEENVWCFLDVIDNLKFIKDNFLKFFVFFDWVVEIEGVVVDFVKDVWKCFCFYLFYLELVKFVVKFLKFGFYFLGYMMVGMLMGVVFFNMLLEKCDVIMYCVWEFGWNCVIGGIYYLSDIEVGCIVGVIIVSMIMSYDDYKIEFEVVKVELCVVFGF